MHFSKMHFSQTQHDFDSRQGLSMENRGAYSSLSPVSVSPREDTGESTDRAGQPLIEDSTRRASAATERSYVSCNSNVERVFLTATVLLSCLIF